jgi:hypothetical protein
MTDDPEQCQTCKAWEAVILPIYIGTSSTKGYCRKRDITRLEDELSCEHYEEFKEE